jgi:hypothetical protein
MNSLPANAKKEIKQFVKTATPEEVAAFDKAAATLLDAAKTNITPKDILLKLHTIIANELQGSCAVKGGSNEDPTEDSLSSIKEENENNNAGASNLKKNMKEISSLIHSALHRENVGKKLGRFQRRVIHCKNFAKKYLLQFITANLLSIKHVLNIIRGREEKLDEIAIGVLVVSLLHLIYTIRNEIISPDFKFRGKMFEDETNENVSIRENLLLRKEQKRQQIQTRRAQMRFLKEKNAHNTRRRAKEISAKMGKKGI